MNRVGAGGRGESAWLGFFLYSVLTDFALVCDARGDGDAGRAVSQRRGRARRSLELAWDGEWFRRGYYDDGTPLGSAQNDECRIDSIAQSWAVLSGAVPAPLAERAMDAVRAQLVAAAPQLVLLLTPPFDQSAQDPGYIKGYLPGVRENGGQYTHAALWVVMAFAKLGSGDEAVELFHMLNPINHTGRPAHVDRYKAEPYVVAGDVYDRAPHRPRRLDLVHGLGRLDVPRGPRKPARPPAARRDVFDRSVHSGRLASYSIVWQFGSSGTKSRWANPHPMRGRESAHAG